MSILEETADLLHRMHIAVETGAFRDRAPEMYTVITPLSDVFALHADNAPQIDVQEVRISIYTKNSYTQVKNFLVRQLVLNGFTITGRRYLGFETDTGYHHYAVDAAKHYEYETEEEKMATIGLDSLYYSKITEGANGAESYGTPQVLAKAISAELSVELNEAILYADDGAAEIVKEFKSGTLSLGIDDIGAAVASDLTGAQIDNNGVVVSAAEDGGQPVAVGFRARKSDGRYRYFWLYRVKFGVPATNLQTKGDSINFSTPTIEGTVTRRNKPDVFGNHPWKTEFTQPTTGADPISADWFAEVYEPVLPTQHSVEPAGDGTRSAGKAAK